MGGRFTEVLLYIVDEPCTIVGPSIQTNIVRSAAVIDEVVVFQAGTNAPSSIAVTFDLTDDDVALEEIETFVVDLEILNNLNNIVMPGIPEKTTINVLDDDGMTL